jgi:hypothetical protein
MHACAPIHAPILLRPYMLNNTSSPCPPCHIFTAAHHKHVQRPLEIEGRSSLEAQRSRLERRTTSMHSGRSAPARAAPPPSPRASATASCGPPAVHHPHRPAVHHPHRPGVGYPHPPARRRHYARHELRACTAHFGLRPHAALVCTTCVPLRVCTGAVHRAVSCVPLRAHAPHAPRVSTRAHAPRNPG